MRSIGQASQRATGIKNKEKINAKNEERYNAGRKGKNFGGDGIDTRVLLCLATFLKVCGVAGTGIKGSAYVIAVKPMRVGGQSEELEEFAGNEKDKKEGSINPRRKVETDSTGSLVPRNGV